MILKNNDKNYNDNDKDNENNNDNDHDKMIVTDYLGDMVLGG